LEKFRGNETLQRSYAHTHTHNNDTQRDVQRNPEKYAQKMRQSIDRDCARIHAVFIQGETSGTKYEPAKVVDFVNNLPGWAPNWARGNRVLKAGAAVLDHLPSTEPRASKSFDRDGNQVGYIYIYIHSSKTNPNPQTLSLQTE